MKFKVTYERFIDRIESEGVYEVEIDVPDESNARSIVETLDPVNYNVKPKKVSNVLGGRHEVVRRQIRKIERML